MKSWQALFILSCFGVAIFGIVMLIKEAAQRKKSVDDTNRFLSGNISPRGSSGTKTPWDEYTEVTSEYDKLAAQRSASIDRQLALLERQSSLFDDDNTSDEVTVELQQIESELESIYPIIDELIERTGHLAEQRLTMMEQMEPDQLGVTSSADGDRELPVVMTAQTAFQTDQKFVAASGCSGIAIDKKNRQFALITASAKVVVPFSQILSSELIVDSDSIIKTDRAGQIGGAIVGGLLTGGFGAVVMAMGAKKKQVQQVRSVELKVLTKSINAPSHTIVFGSDRLRIAADWQDLIAVAIHESANGDLSSAELCPVPSSSNKEISIADELSKLVALKNVGAISEDEFMSIKQSLLS